MEIDLTGHWAGLLALLAFVAAYAAVVGEERLHLRKSIPALVAAGVIWLLVGGAYAQLGATERMDALVERNILEFAELFLFLIVAMTYVNTLEERGVFRALQSWLVSRGLSLRALFWVTGGLAFVMSPVADNLTTALVMGAVATAVGAGNPRFVSLACVNIVVAANAGGAFSPFGDITTLMVWQAGIVPFLDFLVLFPPALVNWLVPALLMTPAIGGGRPTVDDERVSPEVGGLSIVLLFLLTIAMTVVLHSALHLPSAVGMMFGLGLLKLYAYLFNLSAAARPIEVNEPSDVFARALTEQEPASPAMPPRGARREQPTRPVLIFRALERVEWDTLMFFYGVILGVGGLSALGYLAATSRLLYAGLGATTANILVGLISALIDNVPVMFAILTMNPEMSQEQWLLATLTTGVGGSLLSIGSAAGVALMGQARGVYTFLSHLRWSWAVALGYIASISVHLLISGQ